MRFGTKISGALTVVGVTVGAVYAAAEWMGYRFDRLAWLSELHAAEERIEARQERHEVDFLEIAADYTFEQMNRAQDAVRHFQEKIEAARREGRRPDPRDKEQLRWWQRQLLEKERKLRSIEGKRR